MEDGPDGIVSSALSSPPINNGEAEVMANFPNTDDHPASPLKVNGDTTLQAEPIQHDADNVSSDGDALVIDEKQPRKKKLKSSPQDEFCHTNPYFSESIFDLSTQYSSKPPAEDTEEPVVKTVKKPALKTIPKKFRGKNGKPKLREYAQYLGLQPTVQFKCSRCGSAGFPTLQTLNEHITQCTAVTPINCPAPLSNNSTNFRVTRKVFLCSACGTYYENWNLFLHMREVHKRFICLYCLGMFPHAEKLSLHLVSKHNCAPTRYETINDFFGDYKDPCFLMCCDCQTVFSEQENFTNHICVDGVPVKPTDSVKTEEQCEEPSVEPPVVQSDTSYTEQPVKLELNNDVDEKDSVRSSCCANNSESDVDMTEKKSEMVEGETKEAIVENLEAEENENDEVRDNDDVDEEADDSKTNLVDMDLCEDVTNPEIHEDIRKVPKVTLKLPKIIPYSPNDEDEDDDYHSEDSEKLTMEVEKDNQLSDTDMQNEHIDVVNDNEEEVKNELPFATAGVDVAPIELELEQPLDKFDIKLLLQKCLQATIATCLYCNHARKIAVNGKQLGLHAIAEHRYSAIVKSITAEELIPESFNARIIECLEELETVYFNLESASAEGGVTFSHLFECFQCRYSTTVHKELYLHNRKLHANAILLCIMCKTSFYSYSELICHLCPGMYSLEKIDVQFRCCLCVSSDLPSAFRLMVHLRKKHHVCDVCLEMCHNQSRLSNHVWKHKLHHLCYRCGIAYRNKPDITKHLFWKHGTQSVLCNKCMQKKWPHVYHFCIPPTSFTCEECNLSMKRAVSLLVHKRLHAEVFPHSCTEEGCTEKFISKRLLAKHEYKHRQPIEEPKVVEEVKIEVEEVAEDSVVPKNTDDEESKPKSEEAEVDEKQEKQKPKVDVFDLPELNLSESDSSESEDETQKPKLEPDKPELDILQVPTSDLLKSEIEPEVKLSNSDDKPVPVLENIWDNFKNYQATIAKLDILTDVGKDEEPEVGPPGILTDIPEPISPEIALRDHDYCAPTMDTLQEQDGIPDNKETSADHDYCTANTDKKPEVKPVEKSLNNNAKDKTKGNLSSDSSSDSDSSSCTCGSNCSCSSSSDSSSSTSDSSESDSSSEEGRRRQQMRRERRRTKKIKKTNSTAPNAEQPPASVPKPENNAQNIPQPLVPTEVPILESDLDTTETDTDEEFYDKQPQIFANKILAEKREKLLKMAGAGVGPFINGSMIDSRPTTPNLPEEATKPKKSKSKSKKKKKKKSSKHDSKHTTTPYPAVAPITLSISKNSPISTPVYSPSIISTPVHSNLLQPAVLSESDSNTRASKRRRVPNKFYGYSSDEETERTPPITQQIKFRKVDLPTPKSPMVVPPLTIKTTPSLPTVDPISIRKSARPGEMRVQPLRLPFPKQTTPKIKMKPVPAAAPPPPPDQDSATESNTSSEEEEVAPPKPKDSPALYCYCRCPYDEVSEMIGCDADDCAIEWFHFECVGIMVPPKGQWYCPDCRKKKQQKRDMLTQMST